VDVVLDEHILVEEPLGEHLACFLGEKAAQSENNIGLGVSAEEAIVSRSFVLYSGTSVLRHGSSCKGGKLNANC
jgi:hypothetical protein